MNPTNNKLSFNMISENILSLLYLFEKQTKQKKKVFCNSLLLTFQNSVQDKKK